jgi:hypothetical protein
VWLGFCAVEVLLDEPLSPKFQLYEYGGVPPAAEPAKFVVSGIWPEVGLPDAVADSGEVLLLTVIVWVDVAVWAGEAESVTVSVAV